MNLVKHIPNLLTCCNLLSGCFGVMQLLDGNIILAASFIWIGAVFDFLDGFAARVFKSNSDIGLQLDSLADMVTFGVLPASIVFYLLRDMGTGIYAYAAFAIAVFSALRLAKFNIVENDSGYFIGLPSPSSAFFLSALPFYYENESLNQYITPVLLFAITIFLSIIMVSPVRFYSLKIKSVTWEKDRWKITAGIIILVLMLSYKVFAIPAIILTYLITSLLDNYSNKSVG